MSEDVAAGTPAQTKSSDGLVLTFGIITAIAGVIMLVAGAFTWINVSNHLSDEQITVSADAANFAGSQVNGPLQAYAEAEVIEKHAMEATGGKTYAQLAKEDPLRQTAMTASFLRASLFTSVVAYGVALMAVGLGIVNILIGFALVKLAGRRAA